MSRSPSRAEPGPPGGRAATAGGALAAALAALFYLLLPPAAGAATLGDAAPALVDVALAESERLARGGSGRLRPDELLIRNLSRYFTTYPVPDDAEAAGEMLDAARRGGVGWAVAVLELAARDAAASGRAVIGGDEVARALGRLLPSQIGEFDEVIFFPADDRASVAVETIDLAAFLDTGFAWDVLLALAALEVAPESSPPPISEAAVRRLASGVNAHVLLALRLAGYLARLDLAPHAGRDEVERAREVIARRAAGLPSAGERDGPPTGGSVFTEVAAASGLAFRHRTSPWLSRFRRYGTFAPTFSGGGVTAADLDGDGWIDLMLCGGTGCATFRNRGDGTFEDTTAKTGIGVAGEARMSLVADLDGDGWKDLFFTYARDPNRLFRGLPNGRFEDVTAGSGLAREGDISGPAVVFDYDGDGRLDLYVGNFGNYLRGRHPWATDNALNGMPNRLYRNLGGLVFADVSEASAVGNTGWTQAVSHFDHDRDGDQDLYLANDFGRNELLVNNGDGTFRAAGGETGSDDPYHGMNVAFTDLNRDGYGDIFVTNIWAYRPREERLAESNSLLLSQPGDGVVRYRRDPQSRLEEHDTGWAWAACFLDFDNDGRDDLFVANGFTDYLTFIQYRRHPSEPQRLVPINNGGDPNFLFRGEAGGAFRRLEASGAEFDGINSRSAAALDYDRDGDTDLVLTTFHSTTRLLRNDLGASGGWLTVSPRGAPRGEEGTAIGAQIRVRAAGGIDVWRPVAGGGGYLAMDAEEIEIGLGAADRAELEITWPGGARRRYLEVPGRRQVVLFR